MNKSGTADLEATGASGSEPEHEERIARQGFSQIGVFDHVPVLGYREYWYPALAARSVGKKPVPVKLLGEELVFFRSRHRQIVAFWDRCPHRGARLSAGKCEFHGTLSCPYHGYTFDETGTCVAALTEGPDSGLTGKLKARTFPTTQVRGVVFVWMGETAPVPIEEDVPEEFFDPTWAVNTYVATWPANWAITIENSADSHDSYLHRARLRRFFILGALSNFRQIPAYFKGTRVVEEGPKHIGIAPVGLGPQHAYYPLLGREWPQHVWWRLLPALRTGKTHSGKPYYDSYRLPGIIRVDLGNRVHMRWPVPLDREKTRMFTFGLVLAPGRWQQLWAKLFFHTVHRYQIMKGVNELEDVPVLSGVDPYAPQKLGANDRAIIFWRRRMPWKSRDAQRLWKRDKEAPEDAKPTPVSVTE